MGDKEQQLAHLREAVDRKSQEAEEASRQPAVDPTPGRSAVEGDEASLREPGRPQDASSVRDKNSGKGKKTADKWNQ
jgi:hypothetical protein